MIDLSLSRDTEDLDPSKFQPSSLFIMALSSHFGQGQIAGALGDFRSAVFISSRRMRMPAYSMAQHRKGPQLLQALMHLLNGRSVMWIFVRIAIKQWRQDSNNNRAPSREAR